MGERADDRRSDGARHEKVSQADNAGAMIRPAAEAAARDRRSSEDRGRVPAANSMHERSIRGHAHQMQTPGTNAEGGSLP